MPKPLVPICSAAKGQNRSEAREDPRAPLQQAAFPGLSVLKYMVAYFKVIIRTSKKAERIKVPAACHKHRLRDGLLD